MDLDDSQLVARSRRGDIAAFNVIVERYQSQVLNVSWRVVGSFASAEDVTQETFISAYRAIRKFRGGSLRAWLFRIAFNLGVDLLRSSKRRPEDSLDESLETPGSRWRRRRNLPSRRPCAASWETTFNRRS